MVSFTLLSISFWSLLAIELYGLCDLIAVIACVFIALCVLFQRRANRWSIVSCPSCHSTRIELAYCVPHWKISTKAIMPMMTWVTMTVFSRARLSAAAMARRLPLTVECMKCLLEPAVTTPHTVMTHTLDQRTPHAVNPHTSRPRTPHMVNP